MNENDLHSLPDNQHGVRNCDSKSESPMGIARIMVQDAIRIQGSWHTTTFAETGRAAECACQLANVQFLQELRCIAHMQGDSVGAMLAAGRT